MLVVVSREKHGFFGVELLSRTNTDQPDGDSIEKHNKIK